MHFLKHAELGTAGVFSIGLGVDGRAEASFDLGFTTSLVEGKHLLDTILGEVFLITVTGFIHTVVLHAEFDEGVSIACEVVDDVGGNIFLERSPVEDIVWVCHFGEVNVQRNVRHDVVNDRAAVSWVFGISVENCVGTGHCWKLLTLLWGTLGGLKVFVKLEFPHILGLCEINVLFNVFQGVLGVDDSELIFVKVVVNVIEWVCVRSKPVFGDSVEGYDLADVKRLVVVVHIVRELPNTSGLPVIHHLFGKELVHVDCEDGSTECKLFGDLTGGFGWFELGFGVELGFGLRDDGFEISLREGVHHVISDACDVACKFELPEDGTELADFDLGKHSFVD